MPKANGAVLGGYAQYAAQQTHNEATIRLMAASSVHSRAPTTPQPHGGAMLRRIVSLIASGGDCFGDVRHVAAGCACVGSRHSAAINCGIASGRAASTAAADLVPQQMYQAPNRNSSIAKPSTTAARSL